MALFLFIAWASSLGLAFLLGYYFGSLRGRNGNGGNGEAEEVRGQRVALLALVAGALLGACVDPPPQLGDPPRSVAVEAAATSAVSSGASSVADRMRAWYADDYSPAARSLAAALEEYAGPANVMDQSRENCSKILVEVVAAREAIGQAVDPDFNIVTAEILARADEAGRACVRQDIGEVMNYFTRAQVAAATLDRTMQERYGVSGTAEAFESK